LVTLGLLMESDDHVTRGWPKGASLPEGFASPAPVPVADYGAADFLPGEHGELPLAPGQKKKVMPRCCTRIPFCSTRSIFLRPLRRNSRPKASSLIGNRELFAPLASAATQDLPPIGRGHAFAKSVCGGPFATAGLIGPFHGETPYRMAAI
jgi:hypothetical protein